VLVIEGVTMYITGASLRSTLRPFGRSLPNTR